MTELNTLREISQRYAKVQPHQVNNLLEESPVLADVPFQAATHGMWNAAMKTTEINGASFVALNAPLPSMSVKNQIEKVDLSVMGGEVELPEDTIRALGGEGNAFSKNEPTFLKKAGMDTEVKFIYDNFIPYAIANDNVIDAGATSGSTLSIVAVRWIEGETCGLYNPDGFAKGALLDVETIANGSLYKNAAGVLVKGVRYKGYFGLQLLNPDSVGAILNINAENIPTAAQIDDLIDRVKGTPANTKLYMRHTTCNLLNTHKGELLRTRPEDKDINRVFEEWNGIKIVKSYNFLKTETVTAFS